MGVQLGNGMLVEIDSTPRQNCTRWLGQMSTWTTSGVYIYRTDNSHRPWLNSRLGHRGESLVVQGGMRAVWRANRNNPG